MSVAHRVMTYGFRISWPMSCMAVDLLRLTVIISNRSFISLKVLGLPLWAHSSVRLFNPSDRFLQHSTGTSSNAF